MKKKADLHKYRKMINNMHVEESLWWRVAFKKLQKKMDFKKYVNTVNTSFNTQYT